MGFAMERATVCAAGAMAVLLCSCAASDASGRVGHTELRRRGPRAAPGTSRCRIDPGAFVRSSERALLEVSSGLGGAQERYLLLADGTVSVDGAERKLPGGAAEARTIRGRLAATGLFELPQGCYGPPEDGPGHWVETLVVRHRGRIYHYAATNRRGPEPLSEALAVALEHGRRAREVHGSP